MHILSIQTLCFVIHSVSIFWRKQDTRIVCRTSPMRCENSAVFAFRLIFILLYLFLSVAFELNSLFPLFFTICRKSSELVRIHISSYRMIIRSVSKDADKSLHQRKVLWGCYCVILVLIFSYLTDAFLLSNNLIKYISTKKLLKLPRKYVVFCCIKPSRI